MGIVSSLLSAKPRKTTPDGYYDDLIRLSCEPRTKKYTKFKNKTNKTKYNKQTSKQAINKQVKKLRVKKNRKQKIIYNV